MKFNKNRTIKIWSRLLIAPKGIEISAFSKTANFMNTFNRTKRNWNIILRNYSDAFINLLIAPKGIEIPISQKTKFSEVTFNRTKRNWNEAVKYLAKRCGTFNRTKRNWNIPLRFREGNESGLLIAPKGIEITSAYADHGFARKLLIAPKGIEIIEKIIPGTRFTTFNRTKRNWNIKFVI